MKNFILASANITLLIFLVCGSADEEFYCSIADMRKLLETEAVIVRTLEDYVRAEEKRLDIIRKSVAVYQREHSKASDDAEAYVSNPINAYLLIKRLTRDWDKLKNIVGNVTHQALIANITEYHENLKFPTYEDLNEAAIALSRLQDTYKLETSSIARGELNGIQHSSELTGDDCFELGRQSYINEDYYHAVLWMIEALRLYSKESNKTEKTQTQILNLLIYSIYMQDDRMENHSKFTSLRDHYLAEIKRMFFIQKPEEDKSACSTLSDQKCDILDEIPQPLTAVTERDLYEMLCRGDVTLSPHVISKLKCRYVDRGVPFLKLAKVKEEEAFLNPRIVIYHDVIYDSEIETIKRLAQPRLTRLIPNFYNASRVAVGQHRISKSALFKDKDHKHIATVNRRVEDLTSLTTSTAEDLQVANYGIGGHCSPHYDFARKKEEYDHLTENLPARNRIATVLFYMTDVQQGGATVFPSIHVALWPKKGSAAFWYNLHADGEGDYRTLHGACPVLVGSKWVMQKWIREMGQEFRRQCQLTPDSHYN